MFKGNKSYITIARCTLTKLNLILHITVIIFKFGEIMFNGYLVMAPEKWKEKCPDCLSLRAYLF